MAHRRDSISNETELEEKDHEEVDLSTKHNDEDTILPMESENIEQSNQSESRKAIWKQRIITILKVHTFIQNNLKCIVHLWSTVGIAILF